MSEEEDEGFMEPLENSEEEEEDDDEIIIGSDPNEDYRISQFQNILSSYNAYLYKFPAISSSPGDISIQISNSFLPLAQQYAYGFFNNKILLKLSIRLKDLDWKRKPVTLKCYHPDLETNYTGCNLVRTVLNDFFQESYKPQKSYRSASYILSGNVIASPQLVDQLVSNGYDQEQARSALSRSNNDYEKAKRFLETGDDAEIKIQIPVSYNESPLVYLILEICEIFIDLKDHCAICREPLYELSFRPTCCDKELCQMIFSDIGLGSSLIMEIKRDPIVADLLISCFASAFGGKCENPIPSFLTRNEIQSLLSKLPSIKLLLRLDTDQEIIDICGAKLFKLIRWIILSNKCQFVSLPKDLILPEFSSLNYQIYCFMSNPEKEHKFQRLKEKYGSIYLWHGSGADRWHSIFRNNLKIYTDTQYMAHDAWFGPGIYFSRYLQTSFWYASSIPIQNAYTASIFGKSLNIVCLCEIAKVPGLADHKGEHTLSNEDAVTVRFITVNAPINFDTLSQTITFIPTLNDILQHYAKSGLKKSH